MMLLLSWYCIPLLRALLGWAIRLPPDGGFGRVAQALGRLEWAIALLRDTVGYVLWWGVLLTYVGGAVHLWSFAVPVQIGMVAALSVMCSRFTRRYHRRWLLQLIEYAARYPHQHPQHFHNCYFQGLSCCPPVLGASPRLLTLDTLNFRRGGRSRRRLWPLLHATASTFFYSSLVILASRHAPYRSRMREIVDAIMNLWGARLLDLARLEVRVHGIERLHHIDGTVVICANHSSILDFVVMPLAMSLFPTQREPFHSRFLVAKDHFLDNWFYYHGIRIGRGVEAAGMIFVNRHGTPEQRQQAIPDAVRQMREHGVDAAIYPHGTRVPARYDDAGEPIEPGYFTAGWPKRKRPLGQHLKKGAARLACQAAQEAAQRDGRPVYVVPIGIRGAGVILPKGKATIMTEGIIELIVGEPLPVVLSAQAVDADLAAQVDQLHTKIDHALRSLLEIEQHLLAEFRIIMEQEHSPSAAAQLVNQLEQWSDGKDTCLAILDLIAQYPSAQQSPFFAQFSHNLMTHNLPVLASLYHQL